MSDYSSRHTHFAHVTDGLHRTHPHNPRAKQSYTEFSLDEYARLQAPMGLLIAGEKRHRGHTVDQAAVPREAYEYNPAARLDTVGEQRELVRQVGAILQRKENSEREQQHHRQAHGSINTNPRHKNGQVLVDPQWLWDQGVKTNESTHLPGITQVPDAQAPRGSAARPYV